MSRLQFFIFHNILFPYFQINNAQLSAKTIQSRYEDRDQEIFNVMKRLSENELEIGALKDENVDLSEDIAKYQKHLADSETELQKVKKQYASTKGELEELTDRIAKTKDEILNLQRILAEKDNLVEMQRKELFEKDADVETLKTAKKILGKDVNSTKEQLIVHKEKVGLVLLKNIRRKAPCKH